MSVANRGQAKKDPKLPNLLTLCGLLKITVVSAKNLPLREGSAPFIKILVGKHQVASTHARLLSDSRLTPGYIEWNDSFEFELNSDVREVKIVLMDWGIPFSSNPVGTLRMSPGEFVSGSMAGLMREKQILLQRGEGEDAAVLGGADNWFPSDRKPTLVKFTLTYEPERSLSPQGGPQLPPLGHWQPGGGPIPPHAPPPLILASQALQGSFPNRQKTRVGTGILGAMLECPVAKGSVYVPHRQVLSRAWYTRRAKAVKRGMRDDDELEDGAGVMKAYKSPQGLFAFPALFLEAREHLREVLMRLLVDWRLSERWNDLRSFPQGETGVIRQGVGLNDLYPLHTEGVGDQLSEAACLGMFGCQDGARDLDAGLLYAVDKNNEWFYRAWREQQEAWLADELGEFRSEHEATEKQWEESWANIMMEFDRGGEKKCARATLSLKLLVLAHVLKRVIVVMHDEDYSKQIVGEKKIAREDPNARPQSSDAVWILDKPRGRGGPGQRESFRQESMRLLQLGTLRDVNLQGIYIPYMCDDERRRRSPLSLMFCSNSGGFVPLVAQEGQHTDLHFKLPWPPLIGLSNRSGDTFLPLPYSQGLLPEGRQFEDALGGETYNVLPQEVLLRSWIVCESWDETTKRIMSASASTNIRRARRVRAVYAVLRNAETSPEFWGVMRRFVVLADHYRRSGLGQAGEDLAGIDITDHMVAEKPFGTDGYRATGMAGMLEYTAMVQELSKRGRLPRFLRIKSAERHKSEEEVEQDQFPRQKSAWRIGRAPSAEKEERQTLEAQHYACQLAGMGINPRDMDNIVDALRLHILPEVRFDDESGLGKAPSGG